ncbi:Rho GTPase activation protein, partial [Rhizoclosmatium globosum]
MKNPFGKKKGGESFVKMLTLIPSLIDWLLDAGKALDPTRIVHRDFRISDDIELPAVVYRCIEYLDYHKASKEEGIYRLSGSATAIQQLKLMFNVDGIHIDMVDVHAVAGLLKLYLRELPNPVLTKNLHGEFLNII